VDASKNWLFSVFRWREGSDWDLCYVRAGLFGLVAVVCGADAPLSTPTSLCGGISPLEPGEALEVIGEVGHADLDPGAGDADGAD